MKPEEVGDPPRQPRLEPLEGREASELALQDLLELERCGLHVRLPRTELLQAKIYKEPRSATACQQPVAHTESFAAESGSGGFPPASGMQSQAIAAALKDLHEMQAAGMQVRLPA